MKKPPDPIVTDEDIDPSQTIIEDSETGLTYPKIRIRIGLIFAVIGYILFILGLRPGLFNLDKSPVIGFVQISVCLIGLASMTFGSYLTLLAFWANEKKTLAADIGSRLISTGYVICVFTSMADIFGLGSHPLPDVFFGPLQARGMEIGMVTIAIGFLLLIRYKRNKTNQGLKDQEAQDEAIENNVESKPDLNSPSNIVSLINIP